VGGFFAVNNAENFADLDVLRIVLVIDDGVDIAGDFNLGPML
jgi:hypothetical protein